MTVKFMNTDEKLLEKVEEVVKKRENLGLNGLVGGLEAIIINAEQDLLGCSVQELLSTTGLKFEYAFEDEDFISNVLKVQDSADFVVRSRKRSPNPFSKANDYPVGKRLPNTRLETLVFSVKDLNSFVSIQSSQGIVFLTEKPIEGEEFLFIQTHPSKFTGNSLGYIQWTGKRGNYLSRGGKLIERHFENPKRDFLNNIGKLDHCATRVKAQDRDQAILEFLSITNYHFDFAIYVESLNSITNVARLGKEDYAMVFTSGISPFVSEEESGPTEKFAYTYGPRVHHMAFKTKSIDETVEGLTKFGMNYLDELVGSPEEGLKQIFTVPSKFTLLVNEYIERFGDFDGFFTKSNVTYLTRATSHQD